MIILLSCVDEYSSFIEPVVKIEIEKTNFNVLEPVYVTNLSQGELFSFWPGDEGQNFALRNSSRNTGLSPNRGNDFEYVYLRSGTYSMVIVASSYNELTGNYVEKIDSVSITINPGNQGNNFLSFAIDNAWPGYSPAGIIEEDKITIPLAYISRLSAVDDQYYGYLINRRPPLFSVNSSTAKVYSEEGTLLNGTGTDNYRINLIDTATMEPIVKEFTVVQDDNERIYQVAALFYPEMFSISILGADAVKYSYDGRSTPPEEEIRKERLAYPDHSFFGVLVFGNQDALSNTAPTFSITEGAKLILKDTGQEIISGETAVDFTNPPVTFEIHSTKQGYTVVSSVDIYVSVF